MKVKKIIVFAIFTILASILLVGCSTSKNTQLSPVEAVQEAYGSTEFKISFHSQNLEKPISDMTYTAHHMPLLPTPERVGYVFSGWYMDEEFTTPYTDGILYLYMEDVTLYPKWIKEEFVQNGTYDIEFSATILEDTLNTRLEDSEWRDFTKSIIVDETYIEKVDGELMLRIQYDAGETVPFGYYDKYTVAINYPLTGTTNLMISEEVSPDTESIKTIFLDITNFEINAPIYFNITVYDGLEISYVYTVEFKITRFIGFSKSYMDPDIPLDDGYYLVRTNYTTALNKGTMIENYNPVYSYIIVEDGHYTLVKPFSPYNGLIGESATGTSADYYHRGMTFATYTLCYEIEFEKGEDPSVSTKYTPTNYVEYSYEYHAETDKFYNIIDLGTDVKKWFILYGAPTGFMELQSMGSTQSMMHIDYDHIIKLASIDYTPLSGDNYTYNSTLPYYAGAYQDYNSMDVKSLLEKHGAGQDLINFFYIRNGANKTPVSSKITIVPTEATANVPITQSQYMMSEMNVTAQIYGYDYRSNANLYADTITVGLFNSASLRGNKQIKQGKSYQIGETVWLSEIFKEKVNPHLDFTKATYKVYSMTDGKVDYSKALSGYGASFTFEKDVAVLFTFRNTDGSTASALVEVVHYEDPIIEVKNYDEGRTYTLGQKVDNPIVSYAWMGRSYSFSGDLYDQGTEEPLIDCTKTLLLNLTSGGTGVRGSFECTLSAENMALAFSMYNVYGEIYTFYLDYVCRDTGVTKTVTDEEGNKVSIETEDDEYWAKYSGWTYTKDLAELVNATYTYTEGTVTSALTFERCNVFTKTHHGTYTALSDISAAVDGVYAYMEVYYTDESSNTFVQTYLCNVYFNGKTFYAPVSYPKLFTNYKYNFSRISITDGTTLLHTCGVGLYLVEGKGTYRYVNMSSSGGVIPTPGDGRFVSTVYMRYDENGDKLFHGMNGTLQLSFCQEIEIADGKGSVTVEYVTDEAHPFAEDVKIDETFVENGVTYYVHIEEYKLTETIRTQSDRLFDGSNIYAWVSNPTYTERDSGKLFTAGVVIEDFIKNFHNDNIRFYPIWDDPINLIIQTENSRGEMTTIYNEKIYLYSKDTVGIYMGMYEINWDDYDTSLVHIPDGYEFVGWYCPAFRDEIFVLDPERDDIYRYYPDELDTKDIVVTAIVKKPQYVTYIVDYEYSFDSFDQEKIYYGEGISEELENKLAVESKVDGYEFAGWYIQGDSEQTLIDIEAYVVTDDITLVAKFVPVED